MLLNAKISEEILKKNIEIAELIELGKYLKQYRSECPSDKFYIWCVNSSIKLTNYQMYFIEHN